MRVVLEGIGLNGHCQIYIPAKSESQTRHSIKRSLPNLNPDEGIGLTSCCRI